MKSLPSITHITKQHLIFISWIFTLDAGLAVCALPIITFDMRNHVKCEVQTAWMTYMRIKARNRQLLCPLQSYSVEEILCIIRVNK